MSIPIETGRLCRTALRFTRAIEEDALHNLCSPHWYRQRLKLNLGNLFDTESHVLYVGNETIKLGYSIRSDHSPNGLKTRRVRESIRRAFPESDFDVSFSYYGAFPQVELILKYLYKN